MAIRQHKNRNQEPGDKDVSPIAPSNTHGGTHLQVIRNPGFNPAVSAPGEKRGGILPANSQGHVNAGTRHSQSEVAPRRPYVKPAFQHEVVFTTALMTCAPRRIKPSAT